MYFNVKLVRVTENKFCIFCIVALSYWTTMPRPVLNEDELRKLFLYFHLLNHFGHSTARYPSSAMFLRLMGFPSGLVKRERKLGIEDENVKLLSITLSYKQNKNHYFTLTLFHL